MSDTSKPLEGWEVSKGENVVRITSTVCKSFSNALISRLIECGGEVTVALSKPSNNSHVYEVTGSLQNVPMAVGVFFGNKKCFSAMGREAMNAHRVKVSGGTSFVGQTISGRKVVELGRKWVDKETGEILEYAYFKKRKEITAGIGR